MHLTDPLFLLLAFDLACIALIIAVLVNVAIYHILSVLFPGHTIAECWSLFAPKRLRSGDETDRFAYDNGAGADTYMVELHIEHADM